MPATERRPTQADYNALKSRFSSQAFASLVSDQLILPYGLGTRMTPHGQGNTPAPDMSDVADLMKSHRGGTRIVRRKYYVQLKGLPMLDGSAGTVPKSAVRDVAWAITVMPHPRVSAIHA